MSGRNGMKGLVPRQPGDESFADAFDRLALEARIRQAEIELLEEEGKMQALFEYEHLLVLFRKDLKRGVTT